MAQFLQILSGGVAVGATYALVALGLFLVYRVTGVINLAQGAFCILGALGANTLHTALGWPVAAAAAGSVVLTTVAGAGLGAATFAPGLQRLSNGNMMMLTAGLLTLLEGAMLANWGSQPYVLTPFTAGSPLHLGPVTIAIQGLWVFATALAVTAAIWLLLARSSIGRSMRACAENALAARLVGIDVKRMTLLSFALAACLGAVAGVVVAPTTSLQFDSGRLFTISGFIAVVIGGMGSFAGAIVGAMLLGIVQQLATAYVSSLFSNAIALGLLLAVLVFRPNGLLSAGPSRREDVRTDARVAVHLTRLQPGRAWVLAAGVLAVLAALPWLIDAPGIIGGLIISGILFIALLGLDVVMGYAGQVNLGQAGFMALGGYTAGILTTTYDIEPLLAAAAAVVVAILASLLLSAVTMRLRGLYLALATLAFGLLVDSGAVGLIDLTGGPSGLVGIPSFSIAGYDFDDPVAIYTLVLGTIVALVLLLGGVMRGAFGRALQAIRTDPMAAAALGVNVARTKATAMAISAALAALSGSLYAFYFHFLSPEMVGTPRSFELVAMLIVGGEGTLVGPALGCLLLTMLPTLIQPLALYKTFATGGLLVLGFLYLPQGLFGVVASALARRCLPGRTPRAIARVAS